jgi:hypothetical protein
VTFNVGRVAEITATSVVLAQPLLGGVPAAGASAQVIVAFVDREGGSFFQEWSALFVAEAESGGRVCFYYPRLSPNPGMGSSGVNWSSGAGVVQGTSKGSGGVQKGLTNSAGKSMREEFSAIVPPLSAISLRASFLALPYIDANDGQSVLCFRSYFPGGMAAAY